MKICPECGTMMRGTMGGWICPKCGYYLPYDPIPQWWWIRVPWWHPIYY